MGKEDKTLKQPMEFYNMSDFLRGQSSKPGSKSVMNLMPTEQQFIGGTMQHLTM